MNQSVSKAGFFPRLAAFLVDSCIIGIVITCLKVPAFFAELFFPDALIFRDVLFQFNIFDILFYLFGVLYFTLFTCLTGTTIGKRLFNLAVVDKDGNKLSFLMALYRETVGKYLSNVAYFGYIMIFIDKNNRAFHDYLCDSSVIYTCKMRVVKKEVPEYTATPQGMSDHSVNDNMYAGGITNPVPQNINIGNTGSQPVNLYIESTTPQSGCSKGNESNVQTP